jgi:hypothetical protein
MLHFNEIIYRVSFVTWIKKNNQFEHAQMNKKTDFENDQIFREKTNRRINLKNFFDHYHFYVDVKNRFKKIIFLVWHRDVKYRIKFLDLINTKRVEKTFRIALSFRFSQLVKFVNDELHEKRYRFQSNFEISLVQKNHEKF